MKINTEPDASSISNPAAFRKKSIDKFVELKLYTPAV